jgi:hypothetical protein
MSYSDLFVRWDKWLMAEPILWLAKKKSRGFLMPAENDYMFFKPAPIGDHTIEKPHRGTQDRGRKKRN